MVWILIPLDSYGLESLIYYLFLLFVAVTWKFSQCLFWISHFPLHSFDIKYKIDQILARFMNLYFTPSLLGSIKNFFCSSAALNKFRF